MKLWYARRRQREPLNLFQASALTLFVLAIFALALWCALAWALAQAWPWELSATQTTEYSVARMVLFVGAGMIGVIGVVVAYRRQQAHEKGQFLDRLAESARLLGDQNPTIQAAGIYALAGLADTEHRSRQQQCIDVLCSYIRLPYTPSMEDGGGTMTNLVRKSTMPTETGSVEEERTLAFRPYDRQTRETIIRVITQHLRDGAPVSWSELDFDFTGATFDYGDFSLAVFAGQVSFQRAQFVGEEISFAGAKFTSGKISFMNTEFIGDAVLFINAEFTGGEVSFMNAEFTGDLVSFMGATFMGGVVDFISAEFSGESVHFMDAEFINSEMYFTSAKFIRPGVSFTCAKFIGGVVSFSYSEFIGGVVSFLESEFTGGMVSFKDANFKGGVVNFEEPVSWSRHPEVPWGQGGEVPPGVLPREWPPSLYIPPSNDKE
ncbi:pentapeptide repeat-containing protein [Kocuria sp. CNJ-770]|uniref:pentapeptide repeat-containing protein n=1 Tax=Kocuria sp. CNJ-770 TaxID=1904964 RepID=UPI00096AB093|nr:pentapeptide repeat-containing protein [Kocuria sp. CNJ-770]